MQTCSVMVGGIDTTSTRPHGGFLLSKKYSVSQATNGKKIAGFHYKLVQINPCTYLKPHTILT